MESAGCQYLGKFLIFFHVFCLINFQIGFHFDGFRLFLAYFIAPFKLHL